MASSSEQHDAVFDHDNNAIVDDDDDDDNDNNDDFLSQDDDDEDEEEEEEEEEDLPIMINNNDDELIDDDDEEDDVIIDDLNSPAVMTNINNSNTVIPVAVPTTSAPPSAVTVASVPDEIRDREIVPVTVVEERKQPPAILDDSRRLFQRLWTDEDEIELLRGFLDYMTQRTGAGGGTYHHYDTNLFYDQIKSKLQLDFNKNQLVEKLRRLKKKYRTVVSKLTSGKDFSFKSPHDQATYEISRKIWTDIGAVGRSGGGGGGGGSNVVAADDNGLDDDDNGNHHFATNMNLCNIEVKTEDFEKKSFMTTPSASKARPRKRARSKFEVPIDDKGSLSDTVMMANANTIDINNAYNNNNINNNHNSNENMGDAVNGSGNINSNAGVLAAGIIEETMKKCISPLFKELLSGAMNGMGMGGVGGYGGRGLGGLAMNAMPLNLGMPLPAGINLGSPELALDERWRKQQILELEVYSKRLELVQDQIKTTLEDLRSVGG